MAEYSRFFDHIDGDRSYNADDFAEYFRQVLTNGILNGGENLQVYVNGTDRIARIKPGKAWLEGYFYKLTDELQLPLEEAHGTYDRIDRIVIGLNTNTDVRSIKAYVKTGLPAFTPVAPEITREEKIYEISLAQILVVHNTTAVPIGNVTDERLDPNVCGLVNSLIQVDTATMQAEFETFMDTLAGQSYVSQTEFIEHQDDTTTHMTPDEKSKLAKIADGATKVEPCSTNGNIKINGIETNVYWHPAGTNPHGTTAADIGAVPTTRTINNKALSANITLAAADLPDYAEQITNADFNNLTNVGFYVVAGGTVKNAPASGSYFSLIVLKSSNRANTYVNYVQQIAIKENTYETYIRYKTTEWLPWKKMISESGGTMTGILTAQSNTSYTTRQVHNTIVSTEDPSGGSNGDIWIKYKV